MNNESLFLEANMASKVNAKQLKDYKKALTRLDLIVNRNIKMIAKLEDSREN